jgi:hypothetical protein
LMLWFLWGNCLQLFYQNHTAHFMVLLVSAHLWRGLPGRRSWLWGSSAQVLDVVAAGDGEKAFKPWPAATPAAFPSPLPSPCSFPSSSPALENISHYKLSSYFGSFTCSSLLIACGASLGKWGSFYSASVMALAIPNHPFVKWLCRLAPCQPSSSPQVGWHLSLLMSR